MAARRKAFRTKFSVIIDISNNKIVFITVVIKDLYSKLRYPRLFNMWVQKTLPRIARQSINALIGMTAGLGLPNVFQVLFIFLEEDLLWADVII